MEINTFIQRVVQGIGQSFDVPYNHLKWYAEYSCKTSVSECELRQALNKMQEAKEVKKFQIEHNGYITVII